MNELLRAVLACTAVTLCTTACAATSTPPTKQDNTAKDSSAAELAKTALAKELQIDAANIEVISDEAQTWPDSSLGCAKPGTMAAQVITPGHAFILKTSKGNYRVHAAEKYAVVCGAATQWRTLDRPGNRGSALPLRNLNQQIDAARADLASKLHIKQEDITTLGFTQAAWSDSTMECRYGDEAVTATPTKGYKISLQYRDRSYVYHTDLTRVRACPAIEVD